MINNDNILLDYVILRYLEKPSNKGYILYNQKYNKFYFNLSIYDIFDYIISYSAQDLFNLLNKDLNINPTDLFNSMINKKDLSNDLLIIELLRTQKLYYENFRNIISIKKIIITKIDYIPINKIIINQNGDSILNLWNFNNDFKDLKPDINAKFPYLKEFLLNLCGNNIDFYNKFIDVCAWKKQNPKEMLSQCNFIFQDNGGTGKTEIFLDLFLSKLFNVKAISQIELESDYTSFMSNQEWVVVEEVEGYNDAKRIKHLTGAKKILINEKWEKSFETINYSNMIIFSNDLRSLAIDENDRRWNIGGGGLRLSPTATLGWETTYFKIKENAVIFFENFHKNFNQEIKNFYCYIMAKEVKRIDVQQLVNTIERTELININKSSEKVFIDDIIESGLDYIISQPSIFIKNKGEFIFNIDTDVNNGYWISINDLYSLYCSYCNNNSFSRKISKKIFLKKLLNYNNYYKVFEEYKLIKYNNNTFRALKIKNYKNDNIDLLKDIDIIDL